MVRIFPRSANQPNEMALTICNSISRNCFRLMRDLKLENLPNGKEISVVSFRTEKEDYLWRKTTISERIFRKITLFHLTFDQNFRISWLSGKHPLSKRRQAPSTRTRPGPIASLCKFFSSVRSSARRIFFA